MHCASGSLGTRTAARRSSPRCSVPSHQPCRCPPARWNESLSPPITRRSPSSRPANPFVPWGFNYDHDETGRLIEDYWDDEWAKVEARLRRDEEARGQRRPRPPAIRQVHGRPPTSRTPRRSTGSAKLLELAERTGLYLDLTGLGCYHKQDVPAWYDKLAETDRWDAQARFWEAVPARCAEEPGRLLLRPDERAGRARRQSEGRRLARPGRSAASTSCSSSRSISRTGRGPTSPGSGSSTWSPPSASTTSGTWSPWASWTGAWTARG